MSDALLVVTTLDFLDPTKDRSLQEPDLFQRQAAPLSSGICFWTTWFLFLDPNRSKESHQVGQQEIAIFERLAALAVRFEMFQNVIDRTDDVLRGGHLLVL